MSLPRRLLLCGLALAGTAASPRPALGSAGPQRPQAGASAVQVQNQAPDSLLTPARLLPVVESLRVHTAALDRVVRDLQRAAGDSSLAVLETQDGDVGPSAVRVQETAQDLKHFGLRSIWAVILVGIAWLVIRSISWMLGFLSERNAKRRLLFKKLIPIARLLIWSLTILYIVARVFAVDRAGLVAATAALGVGIGFAAQGVLRNVLGGLIIIFDQPFQVGDKIRVAGTYGEVVSIGMRATRIVTADDNLVSVPNSQIVEDQVANANAGELHCQVVVDLYLPSWCDIAQAKAIGLNAALNSPYTYLEKPVVVNVHDQFDRTFFTHLAVKAYVIDTRYEFALASEITEVAKTEFQRAGFLTPAALVPADPVDYPAVV